MGMSNPEINWHAVYTKAIEMLNPGGVIVGRQLYSTTMANPLTIKQAIKPYVLLENPVSGSFIINGKKWVDCDRSKIEYIRQTQLWVLK